VTGTPEDVAACEASFTGQYLRPLLERITPSPLAGEGRLSEAERGEGAPANGTRSPATAGAKPRKNPRRKPTESDPDQPNLIAAK
jgi:hypothetical protein